MKRRERVTVQARAFLFAGLTWLASTVACADEGVSLDNLVPYTSAPGAWSDRHSDITISWPNPDRSGIQQLNTIVGWWGSSITDSLLTWSVKEDGRPIVGTLTSRNFRPDKIVETSAFGEVLLTASTAFPARDVLAVEFVLENSSPRTRMLDISFTYPGIGVAPDWEGAFPLGLITTLDGAPEGSWTTLFQHREHGRNVYGVSQFVAGMIEGTPLELACMAELAAATSASNRDRQSKFTVAMAFGRNRGIAQDGFAAAKQLIKAGWTPASETARIERLIAAAPPLPLVTHGSHRAPVRPRDHRVEQSVRPGQGGYFEGNRVPYTTKFGVAMPYFWDSMMSAVGAREFEPALSQETIEAFLRNATPRGSLPFSPDRHPSRRRGPGAHPWLGGLAYLSAQQ